MCITPIATESYIFHYLFCLFSRLGSTCNHVAAIMFKVEHYFKSGYTASSCTSRKCEWKASSRVVEPRPVCEMDWKKPCHTKSSASTINPKARQLFSPHRNISSANSGSPSIEHIVNCLFPSNPDAAVFQYVDLASPPANYAPEDDVNVGEEVIIDVVIPTPLSVKLLEVSSYLDFTPKPFTNKEIEAVEELTRGQGETWRRYKRGVITASHIHKVQNSKNTDSVIKAITREMEEATTIPALKYGKEMEPVARKDYVKKVRGNHKNFQVRESGLVLSKHTDGVGASPDGFINCTCCGKGVLEIKCPYSLRSEDPATNLPPYICDRDGVLALKVTHPYYYQVQFQMEVCERDYCDFFVYTSKGSLTIRIAADKHFGHQLMTTAQSFFNESLAPAFHRILHHEL